MNAIVLAAGRGARMEPLTNSIHKSLLRIGETTILARIMDGLLALGVDRIVVVTGYRADEIEQYLASQYPGAPIRCLHNSRYAETNNIVSLAMALDDMEIASDVVLVECDVLFDAEVLELLRSPEPGNIALVDRYRPGMDGTVVSVEGGYITHVFPPHLQTEDFDYSDKCKTLNIYRFERDFCRQRLQPLLSCYANVIDSGCYYELVLGMLINMQREQVRAAIVDGSKWAEVDDPNDLASARFTFEPDARSRILDHAKGGHWNFPIIDFSFMRNMYFPSDAMMAAMRRALPALVRSYGSAQEVLNEKLAYVLQCRTDRLQCLSGAAQLFPRLAELLPCRRALIPAPTFGEYSRWLKGGETYSDAVGVDTEGLAARAGEYELVVVVNPNNPTGSVLSTEWLHRLAKENPRTMFLVDESFAPFADQPSLLEGLEQEPLANVVVLASLSKSLGVPGLRLGYVYSRDLDLVTRIGEGIPIWNLGAPAEFLLELVLKFRSELNDSFRRTRMDRAQFFEILREAPGIAEVYPSAANFLLCRIDGADACVAARVADDLLADEGVYVKDVSARFADDRPYLRLAVRHPAENVRAAEALARRIAEARA